MARAKRSSQGNGQSALEPTSRIGRKDLPDPDLMRRNRLARSPTASRGEAILMRGPDGPCSSRPRRQGNESPASR
jgi:hypothetical protein